MNPKTRIHLLVWFMLFALSSTGQNFDQLMVKKQLDCEDISYNSSLLFKKYYNDGKLDSAKLLIDYWELKCGPREPIFRAKLLLELRKGTYSDALIDDKVIDYLQMINYRYNTSTSSLHSTYEAYKSDFSYIPPMQEFDKFTAEAAEGLNTLYGSGTIERVWCDYLSRPSKDIFLQIQNPEFAETTLAQNYYHEVAKYKDMQEFHMAWITGAWIPNGMLAELGVHPDMGLLIGVKKKTWSYDMALTFKFANTPDYYYARRTKTTGDWEPTKHFFGGYFGLEVGKDIWAKGYHELQLNGGIAYDGFDVFKSDNYNDDVESTSSYNFNVGLGYRYYLKSGTYLGLRAKYNLVDYTLNNVIDHSGNVTTVHFVIGNLSNIFKKRNLENLNYTNHR